MNRDAYQLQWEVDHLSRTDEEFDLTDLQGEPAGVPHSWPTETHVVALPHPIVLAANFGHLDYTDYPSNPLYWPVMSRPMLDVLYGVGAFPHHVIPVSIVDPVVYTQEEHEAEGFAAQRLQTANHDFVIVQLTGHLSLDEEASGVRRDPELPWMVEVEQYVFTPGQRLPPLFRLTIDSTPLYISAQARAALGAAGIRGPRYLPLEGGAEKIDVPVPEPVVGRAPGRT